MRVCSWRDESGVGTLRFAGLSLCLCSLSSRRRPSSARSRPLHRQHLAIIPLLLDVWLVAARSSRRSSAPLRFAAVRRSLVEPSHSRNKTNRKKKAAPRFHTNTTTSTSNRVQWRVVRCCCIPSFHRSASTFSRWPTEAPFVSFSRCQSSTPVCSHWCTALAAPHAERLILQRAAIRSGPAGPLFPATTVPSRSGRSAPSQQPQRSGCAALRCGVSPLDHRTNERARACHSSNRHCSAAHGADRSGCGRRAQGGRQ